METLIRHYQAGGDNWARSCSYRTRDVHAYLAKCGLQISSLDFRRFCTRHGIRRDMRAGRPRKLTSVPAVMSPRMD